MCENVYNTNRTISQELLNVEKHALPFWNSHILCYKMRYSKSEFVPFFLHQPLVLMPIFLFTGCGRTKLFWLMALADSLTLKAMVEFRDGSSRCNKNFTPENSKSSTKINFSTCRFCLRQSSPDYPVMDSLCSDKECLENSKLACAKVLNCGHYCGGILGMLLCPA